MEAAMRAYVCILTGLLATSAGCTKYRVADADGGDARPSADAGVDGSGSGGATGAGGNANGTGGTGAGGTTGSGGITGLGGNGAGGQINTQFDGKNCGTVGHDCLGGQCQAGMCQPVLIAQYLGEPLSLAVGPTFVCETNIDSQIGC